MGWLFVPESAASKSASAEPCPGTEHWCTWRGKPMRPQSWRRAWVTEGWMRLLSGMTLSPSTAQRGVDMWMSSQLGSPASPGPREEPARRPTTTGGSGPSSPASFATFDPSEQSSWRTSRAWRSGGSTTFSGTWPKRGSMLSGGCIELSMSGLPTDGRGSSSSPTDQTSLTDFFAQPRDETPGQMFYPTVWPTPVTTDAFGAARHTSTQPGCMALTDAMRLFLSFQAELDPSSRRLHARQEDGEDSSMQAVLYPPFVEALMGYPLGWSECAPSGTPSSRPSSPGRGGTS